jgi:Dullard-like phosphatase family protein
MSLSTSPSSSLPVIPPLDPANPIELNHRHPNNPFYKSCMKLHFEPLESSLNYSGNYRTYVSLSLEGIVTLSQLNYNIALQDPSLKKNFPSTQIERCLHSSTKKLLLLDLDETLIHADFDGEYPSKSYDAVISFMGKKGEKCSVGVFIRNGLSFFLENVSKEFEIGIFTASTQEYADAVIKYIDPDNKYFKFKLYRDACVSACGVNIKDLSLISSDDNDMKRIVLVDNSLYSFANQIRNGVLINSFYNDKNDYDLLNVMNYLLNYLVKADDVREVNEQVFNFEDIMNQLYQQQQQQQGKL